MQALIPGYRFAHPGYACFDHPDFLLDHAPSAYRPTTLVELTSPAAELR
jgi:hypothetical protein